MVSNVDLFPWARLENLKNCIVIWWYCSSHQWYDTEIIKLKTVEASVTYNLSMLLVFICSPFSAILTNELGVYFYITCIIFLLKYSTKVAEFVTVLVGNMC